jgi:hypothetical protein
LNPDTHLVILQESFETLIECVDKGLERKQRTVGFHTSLAAAEMLELYLHKIGLFPVTFRLNHAWMKSQRKIKEKIPHDFPEKDRVIQLMYYIEKNRDILCYGKLVERSTIKEQLDYFNELRNLFVKLGLDEIA